MQPGHIGEVASLWRYPVKSMAGEPLRAVHLHAAGIFGDRLLAFESAGAALGKPLLAGAERTAILLCRAALIPGDQEVEDVWRDGGALAPSVEVAIPEMGRYRAGDPEIIRALRQYLATPHALRLKTSPQPMTDCRPLGLISTQTVRQLSEELGTPIDAQRFRANLILRFREDRGFAQGFVEDALVGRRLRIGEHAVVRITERDPRCRIIALDPNSGEAMPTLMRHVARAHDGKVGIYGVTEVPGPLAVGDPVLLLP